jgi:hypothetical protein
VRYHKGLGEFWCPLKFWVWYLYGPDEDPIALTRGPTRFGRPSRPSRHRKPGLIKIHQIWEKPWPRFTTWRSSISSFKYVTGNFIVLTSYLTEIFLGQDSLIYIWIWVNFITTSRRSPQPWFIMVYLREIIPFYGLFFSGERHIVIYINLPRSIYKLIIFMDIWNILIINGLYYPLFPCDSDRWTMTYRHPQATGWLQTPTEAIQESPEVELDLPGVGKIKAVPCPSLPILWGISWDECGLPSGND